MTSSTPPPTRTPPPFEVRAAIPAARRGPNAVAEDLGSALSLAWQLQRHLEAPVEIVDHRDGDPRVIAVVNVEWKD